MGHFFKPWLDIFWYDVWVCLKKGIHPNLIGYLSGRNTEKLCDVMGYSTLSDCPERLLVGVRWPWWLYRYCPFKTMMIMMGDKLWWHVASLQFWWCTSDHCFWDHFFEMLRCRISCEVLATSVFHSRKKDFEGMLIEHKPLLWSCLKMSD